MTLVGPTVSPAFRAPHHLAKPLVLPSGVVLPNRIVKAAMAEGLAEKDGAPSEALTRLYRRWGTSGAGMLLTGNVMIAHDARGELDQVVVEDARHLGALAAWAEAAQAAGTPLFMQINHAGRQTPRSVSAQPLAPSAVPLPRAMQSLFAPPRAMDQDDIVDVIRRFATTASIAKNAGFGGVQIHAAHGYLLSQFLSPLTNRRDDAWGGDAARRTRLLVEIVRAVRAAVGPAFPIAVKLNSADFQRGGFEEADSMTVVETLEREGIDLLEISGGNYESPAMMDSKRARPARASTRAREAYFLDYARRVRARVKTPLLLTGGLRTAATMERILEEGAVDAVGLARPMAVEPDLPGRLLSGAATGARPIDVSVGIRVFDDMLQTLFMQAQLRRMGRGAMPDPTLSRWRVLFAGLLHAFVPRPRPRAPQLAAGTARRAAGEALG